MSVVRVGVAQERTFVLGEVAIVAHGFVRISETMDGKQLCGVGEKDGVDFVAVVCIVLGVEIGKPVLELCRFDAAVVDDDDNVILLSLPIAKDGGFGRELVFGRRGECDRRFFGLVCLTCALFVSEGDFFTLTVGLSGG